MTDFTTPNSDFGVGGAIAAGRELADRRRAAYLTQVELAALAGCSLSSVTNLEAGAIPSRSKVLRRVEAVLDERESNEGTTR